MKKVGFLLLMCSMMLIGLSAETTLQKGGVKPVIDGVISTGEYAFLSANSGMRIGASLNDDGMLYLAYEAPTDGWVSLGINSLVMNGAHFFFGSIENGKPVFTEQDGAGHGHSDAASQLSKKSAVKNVAGRTTLEFSIPADKAVASNSIKVLYAFAKSSSLSARHSARGSFTIGIAP